MLIHPNEVINPRDLRIVKITGNFPTRWEIERRKTNWFKKDTWVTAMSSYNLSGAYCGNPWKLTYESYFEAHDNLQRLLTPYYETLVEKEVL